MKKKSNWQYAIHNMQIVHRLLSKINRQLPFANCKLRIFFYLLPIACSLLFIQSCNNAKYNDEQNVNAEPGQSAPTGMVELTQTQMKTAGILLGNFKTDTISTAVEANGHTELLPNNQATINTPINGFIEKINCIEGKPVKKGALLFVVKHPDIIELQKNYIQSVNEFNVARKEVDRQKILSDANVSAQKQYQHALASFQTARAQKNAIAEKLQFIGINPDDASSGKILNTISVYAPFSGVISKVYSHKGQLVSPDEAVAEIINTRKLLLKLNVFEQDINKTKPGQKLSFVVPSFGNSKMYQGTVSYVGKSIDPETRTIGVTSVLTEFPDLIPGVYVEAKLLSNPRTAGVLPNESIVTDAEGKFVFKLESDINKKDELDELTFRKMKVETGSSENGSTEILNKKEFPANAIFVTKGAHYLNSELGKGEIDDD